MALSRDDDGADGNSGALRGRQDLFTFCRVWLIGDGDGRWRTGVWDPS